MITDKIHKVIFLIFLLFSAQSFAAEKSGCEGLIKKIFTRSSETFSFKSKKNIYRRSVRRVRQYFHDVRENPRLLIIKPHDPDDLKKQTLFGKVMSAPLHYLDHPVAEILGRKRQFSFLPNVMIWTAFTMGVKTLRNHQEMERQQKFNELLTTNPQFLDLRKTLEYGLISLEEAIAGVRSRIRAYQEVLATFRKGESSDERKRRAFYDGGFMSPVRKLRELGVIKSPEDLLMVQNFYYRYYWGLFELHLGKDKDGNLDQSQSDLGSKISAELDQVLEEKSYSLLERMIISSWGMLIPDLDQVLAAKLASSSDALISGMIKHPHKGTDPYFDFRRVIALHRFRQGEVPFNDQKLEVLTSLAPLDESTKNEARERLVSLFKSPDKKSWLKTMVETKAWLHTLEIIPERAVRLLFQSYYPQLPFKAPLQVLDSSASPPLLLESFDALEVYATLRFELDKLSDLPSPSQRLYMLAGLQSRVISNNAIRERFAKGVPKLEEISKFAENNQHHFPDVNNKGLDDKTKSELRTLIVLLNSFFYQLEEMNPDKEFNTWIERYSYSLAIAQRKTDY